MPHNCICLCQRKKIVSSLFEWVLRWLELYLFVLGYYSYFFFNFLLQLYCISLAKFPSLSSQKMVFIETRENLKEKQLWWVEGISLFLHITKTFKIASNHLVFLWLTWLSVPVITLALQQSIIMMTEANDNSYFVFYDSNTTCDSFVILCSFLWFFTW